MLNLTKQQTIAEHRKMWRWIADETKKQGRMVEKAEYFDAMGISPEDRPAGNCYCCDYTDGNCLKCPIEWGGDYGTCLDRYTYDDGKGLFGQWIHTNNPEEAARLAHKIAELPERR